MVSSSFSFSSINVISTAVVVAVTMILILSHAINSSSVDDDDDDGEALRGTSGVDDCGVFFISQPPLSLPL